MGVFLPKRFPFEVISNYVEMSQGSTFLILLYFIFLINIKLVYVLVSSQSIEIKFEAFLRILKMNKGN